MNAKIVVVVIVLLLVVGSVVSTNLITSTVRAQDSATSNMQSLIERLVNRMNDEHGFRIFIDFEHPLVEDQATWEIGDPNDRLQRSIVEVGQDYICFQEIGLAADGRRCTPFTNIVSVFYLNN